MTPARHVYDWPKSPVQWIAGRTLFISIPFTWNLPAVVQFLSRPNSLWDQAVVGGPAVYLMPELFDGLDNVTIGYESPGVLQRVNPQATRTTVGCIRHCQFCAIGQGKVEAGGFRELSDWPDLPVLADNNLLAASGAHFDRVMERLERWGWADFTQGLDARLLTDYHAERLKRIAKPMVRLALDSMAHIDAWEEAYAKLRRAKIAKNNIRSYALIAHTTGLEEAWERCDWIEQHGVKALPMWFHPLDALSRNVVTESQAALGWDDAARQRIMQWFYMHRGTPLVQHSRLRGKATSRIEQFSSVTQTAQCQTFLTLN